MVNPTEKNIIYHANKDEPWIRDIQAATVAVMLDSEKDIAAMCEGEDYFCEICGKRFPLWPVQEWAAHFVAEHSLTSTLQQHQSIFNLCTAGLTGASKQFISIQLMTRATLRRRARDLKMTFFVDAEGKRIPEPGPRIIQ